MIQKMTERAREYLELKEELHQKQEEVRKMKDELFGSDASETEKKARDFFTEVSTDSTQEGTKELDKLKEEVDKLEKKFEDAHEDFLNSASELKFPLEHRIEEDDDKFSFPFKEELEEELIEALKEALNSSLKHKDIELTKSSLEVEAETTDDAMDKVSTWVTKVREEARNLGDKNKYVSKLKNRDLKIQNMLYELYKSEEPLKKGELEKRIDLEKGALRGVLYQVLNNEPYLQKDNQEFSLTTTGREVMKAYENKYDKPDPISNGGEE